MTTLVQGNPWKPLKKAMGGPGVVREWRPATGFLQYMPDAEYTRRDYLRWYSAAVLSARANVNAFIEFIMSNDWDAESRGLPVIQQWFHEDLQDMLDAGRAGRPGCLYSAVAMPRSHGKTTQMIGRILWELGHDPNLRIRIVAETAEVARLRVKEIKAHIERNKFLHVVFPKLRENPSEAWQATQLTVERDMLSRDPTLSAGGILGGGTGGRVNILVGDDVVGRMNSVAHPRSIPEVISAWEGAWMPQVVRGGRVWYFCTTWHPDDLSHKLIRSKEYKSMVVPIGPDDEAVWPELVDQQGLKDKRRLIGDTEFGRGFSLAAGVETDSPVDASGLKYVALDEVPEGRLSYLLSVDLAVGKTSGDFFTIVVFGVDFQEHKMYVLDFWRSHQKIHEQLAQVSEFIKEWEAKWVVVEAVAYQEAFADLLRHQFAGSPFAPQIEKFHPVESKRSRLEAVSPRVHDGSVMFLDRLDPNMPDCDSELVRQIVEFGIQPHDDLCDAFSQGVLYSMNNLPIFGRASGVSVTLV